MSVRYHAILMLLGGVALGVSSATWSQDADRKPAPMRSLAEPVSAKTLRDGPRFKTVEAMLAAARRGDDQALKTALTSASSASLSYFSDGRLKRRPFDVELVKTLHTSCLGPFSVDEGRSWVQLSWVCDEQPNAAVAKFVIFRNSPELSVTIFFDGNAIRSIDAIEPLPFPGARMISKGAYVAMKKNG